MSQRSRGDDSTIAGNLPAGADATAEAHPITDGLGRQARPKLHFFAVAVVVASASVASFAVAQESKLDALRGAAKASPADPNAALAFGDALRIAGHYSESFAEFR